MPKPIEPIVATVDLAWPELRQAIKRCIESVAPNARVYSRWPLKYDIGKTATLLKSSKDGGKIHAWIIRVGRAEPYSEKVGGDNLKWDLVIRIWGFLGYEYGEESDNTQDDLEEEARLVTQVLFKNRNHLSLDNTQALSEVGLLKYNDIDVHGFGEDDIHVAQGELRITLNEFFS